MPSNPPVNFEELVKGPTGTTGKDYPYAIKASDLMKDFVFATLDIAEGVYTETTGAGGHSQRRLNIDAGTAANQIYIWDGSKITVIATPTEGSVLAFTGGEFNYIPATEGSVLVFTGGAFSYVPAPGSGTHVLGSVGGTIQWIATEEC
jgi:hypothetical protein